MRRFFIVTAILAAMIGSARDSWARDFFYAMRENYIRGNTNFIAVLDIPVIPDDGNGWTDCHVCPQNHVTSHSSLPFQHWHQSAIPFPADAFDENGLKFKLEAAQIDRYYDAIYGYDPNAPASDITITKEGEIDTSMNCHSYALGYGNLWIEDADVGAGIVYVDDYTIVGQESEPAVGDVGAKPNGLSATHSWKVTQVKVVGSGGPKRITQTKEKFRSSKIYVTTYTGNAFVAVVSEINRPKP